MSGALITMLNVHGAGYKGLQLNSVETTSCVNYHRGAGITLMDAWTVGELIPYNDQGDILIESASAPTSKSLPISPKVVTKGQLVGGADILPAVLVMLCITLPLE
jgi:hypothetical protein